MGVAFGLLFTAYITLPFTADVVDIFRRKQPLTLSATIVDNNSIFGLAYLHQSLHLQDIRNKQKDSYVFFYSFAVLRAGRQYDLKVLGRSLVVLDEQEVIKPK
jgi:hypothetical protein